MKKAFVFIGAALMALGSWAQSVMLVELIDMYGTSEVKLMSSDELRELRTEIQEETSAYPKALAAVKKEWDQKVRLNREFPKFVDPRLSVRKIKAKGPLMATQAEAELEKLQVKIERENAKKAQAEKDALKAAKGRITAAATNNKKIREQERKDMQDAVKEQIAKLIDAKMEEILERPVPKTFAVNAAEGMSKAQEKEKAIQDAKIEAARKRKAEQAEQN